MLFIDYFDKRFLFKIFFKRLEGSKNFNKSVLQDRFGFYIEKIVIYVQLVSYF